MNRLTDVALNKVAFFTSQSCSVVSVRSTVLAESDCFVYVLISLL